MSTCNIILLTCNMIMSTCDIIMLTCVLIMFHVNKLMLQIDINKIHVNIIMMKVDMIILACRDRSMPQKQFVLCHIAVHRFKLKF